MTHIIKLEMKGFKSFANKTEIVLGNDFNVILGPNGSGKSNVLDALCFVLAKSSAKGMRAEKSANLIYNGGKSKKGAKEGEVSIYFDNTSKLFPIDEDVVKVTRIIRESGQSIYKINDQKHTRNEIVELLNKAKINPDGYNIILQGDIIRFVEMSSVERRQMLEEVAGISLYEEKKNKAERELDKVDNSLNDAKIILTEREHYLKELKEERDQAIKVKEMQEDLHNAKGTLVKSSFDKKNEELKVIEEKLGGSQEKIDKVQQQIDELKEKVKGQKEEVSDINKQIEQRGEKEQVELHKEVESLKVSLLTKKQRSKDLDGEISRISNRSQQLEANKKDITDKIAAIKQEVNDIKAILKGNESEQSDVTKKIQTFKKKHNLEDAAGIDAQVEDIDKQADVISAQLQDLRVKQQDDIREQDRLEIQINNMDEKIGRVKELEKEHKSELQVLTQQKKEFKKATLDLSTALTQDSSINSQLSTARATMNKLREEEAKLNARNASLQESLGADRAISEVIKNKSTLGEVHGTVSSLASVESKFALALEVAAGNRMKAIVVGSDQTASKCIKFLRDQQLGVATFLPMNKMRPRKVDPAQKKLADSPGCFGFADQLIEYDNNYKTIFSYVFGNVLVVQDLATARKIGVGSVKMVTLDGDVVETSGSMRGGFLKTKGRAAGFQQKEVTQKMNKLTKEIGDAQNLISTLENKKTGNEDDIVQLRELKANLEGEIIKKEKSLHIDSQDLDVSKKLKEEFKEKLKEVNKSFNEMQKEITSKNRELATLKTKRGQLREQLTTLRNPTKLAELNSFEDKLQNLRSTTMEKQGQITNKEHQIKQILQPELDNIDKIINQHNKEIESFKKEQGVLNAQVKELDAQVKDKEAKEQAFYKQFKEYFAKRNKIQEGIEKTEEQIIGREEQIRDLERRGNVVSLERARVKAELMAVQEEMDQYPDFTPIEKDLTELKRMVTTLQNKLINVGAVNMKALEIYEKVQEEYEKLVTKRDKLVEEKETIYEMINEIETRKTELFLKMFDIINTNFKKIFSSLSAKGDAFLELEEPERPFDGGVRVKVRLSGTKFMDIRSLSGGEKTMTALAFIFAIQENDPASFYIMDEVDAALDKRNSERLANLVNSHADRAQYVVISHNDGVIASANNLYGVSMNEHGISKVVSLKI